MPSKTKPEPVHAARKSSVLSTLSDWARQGTESFFATQKILLDLVMRQNANTMHAIRERAAVARTVPAEMLTEFGGEGLSSFIDAQRVLLHLAQRENEIVLTGVKERVGGVVPIGAATDLLRRGVDTFIEMQQHFLTIASKQTDAWIDSRRSDTAFAGKSLAELAQESIENFVRSQKKFLDIVAEESEVMLTGGNGNGAAKHAKKTELAELARQGSEAFIDAQKKLLDVATQQMSINLKTASKSIKDLNPLPPETLVELSRQTVDSFVTAQKALLDVARKPAREAANEHPAEAKLSNAAKKRRPRRPVPVTV
jgi:hypothetical protein